jgi:hypothetical protein
LAAVTGDIVGRMGQTWDKKIKLPYGFQEAQKSGGLYNDDTGANISCLFKDRP